MTKFQKFVLGLVSLVSAFALILTLTGTSPTVGGVYSLVNKYFYDGISVGTTNQFAVSSAGALTTSGLVTATGGLTLTGVSSIGSITTGLNYYKPVLTPTSDTTLTVAQTGSIVNMATAGLDITLPAPTAANGVHYRFVVSGAFATTDMTLVAGTADTIEGSLIVAGAVVACDAADIITIAAANEDIGDFIDMYSNGTKWMIGANQAMTASNHACSG